MASLSADVGNKIKEGVEKAMDKIGNKLGDRNDKKLEEANRKKKEAEKKYPKKK